MMIFAARKAARCAAPILLSALLAACAAAPSRPNDVALKTDMAKPLHPSINASVLTDATVLDSRFAASLDPDADTLTRLESSYTLKFSEDEDQLRLGDSVSTAGLWGSSVRYGGVQFGTRFAPNAEVLHSERLATKGISALPTAADALFAAMSDSNTLLTQQSLSINGTPHINDRNAVNLVARDSLGRSESMSAPLLAQTRLVEAGCSDFTVGLGKVRRDYAVTSNEYGPLFANTTVACAAPLGFTIEGHGEFLAEEVAALGLGLARRLGPIGTASLAFASSDTEVGAGWLARVGFEHQSSLLNLAVRSHIQSREFREVGSVWIADPIMQRNLASVGLTVSESASIALAYAAQTTWEQERVDILSLNQKMNLGRGSISMSAGHSFAEEIGSSVFISYKRPFGTLVRRARFDASDLELLEVTLRGKRIADGG